MKVVVQDGNRPRPNIGYLRSRSCRECEITVSLVGEEEDRPFLDWRNATNENFIGGILERILSNECRCERSEYQPDSAWAREWVDKWL